MLHILWSIVLGFIAGFLAKHIMAIPIGLLGTILIGVIGSIVGGLIARLFSSPREGQTFHPAGLILSTLGAVVTLFVWSKIG